MTNYESLKIMALIFIMTYPYTFNLHVYHLSKEKGSLEN